MAIEKIRQRADGRMFLDGLEIKGDGMYGDGGCLYLQVSHGGRARSWQFRYAIAPRRYRAMGLGPLHTISLAEARELALQWNRPYRGTSQGAHRPRIGTRQECHFPLCG